MIWNQTHCPYLSIATWDTHLARSGRRTVFSDGSAGAIRPGRSIFWEDEGAFFVLRLPAPHLFPAIYARAVGIRYASIVRA
jgi:hypothetical protein